MSESEVARLRAELAALQARIVQLEGELAKRHTQPLREENLPYQNLPKGEVNFRAIFENAGIGIGLIDFEGRTLATNPALQRLLGRNEQEIAASSGLELSFPEDQSLDDELFGRMRAGEIPRYQIDKRYRRSDGSIIYGRLTVTCISDDSGPQYAIGMVEDVTLQKQTILALEEAQRRFDLIAENVDVVFWIFDVRLMREVYNSPAYARIWGRSVQSAYAEPYSFQESILPEDLEATTAAKQLVLQGTPSECEYRIRKPDGTIRYILDKGFPIFDDSGTVIQMAGVATDVTDARLATEHIRHLNETLEQSVQERTQELRDALAQLQEQRDFSLQITESMREGVIVYDADGIIRYANPFISELTGIPLERIIGGKDRLAELAENSDLVRSQMGGRRSGQNADYEVTIRHADGEQRHIRILSTPRMVHGKYDGGIAVISDMTQRRQAEAILRTTSERLAQANRELARAARMKDEFLANVSHELRTPLTGILALSEALLADTYGEVPLRQQRPLAMIEESGRHLLSLINDVLDVAKAEAGKLDIAPEPLSADDLCQASLRLVRDLANRKNQQVSCILEPPGLKLLGDPRRLKQVLVNLLSNAVKFTPQGGRLGIRVHADEQQHTVTFTVWDEGIGIPPDQLKRIFEPFVQVESESSRSYSGTGLGLTLVRRLAELHMGTVLVESEPSRGSQFHVILPWQINELTGTGLGISVAAAVSAAVSAAVAGSSQPEGAAVKEHLSHWSESGHRPTVLLAEDNAITRAALEEYLGLQGLHVLVAADGLEALELATTRRPDLVLMDIQMPKMDGLEAIRRIRALNDAAAARVPIIALTAHAMSGDREQFLRAGANGYLSKPVRLAELRQQIAAYVPQLVE